jgi:hypothetical protein
MKWHPMCTRCGWRMGGLDSWDGARCRCGKSESREVDVGKVALVDPSRPVRVSRQGLEANPAFVGLTGTVTSLRVTAVSVYFPDRGATTIWLHGEIENVPLPSNHNHDERKHE